MGKKKTTSKRHQTLYKMKGCSKKKSRKSRKYRRVKGGSALEYKGGQKIASLTPETINSNAYPNGGPSNPYESTSPTNYGTGQKGGTCGACGMTGGTCGSCGIQPMNGGGCGCGTSFFGDKKMAGGGNTIPGSAWSSNPSDWPGVNGSESGNHLALNEYNQDPQTATVMGGVNPPYSTGGRKGRGKGKGKKSRKQKGGVNSNMFFQDFVNLGRQLQFNLGSTSNALNGFAAPLNPMPWKDQLPNSQDNILRASAM